MENKIDLSRGDLRIELRKCGRDKNSIVILDENPFWNRVAEFSIEYKQ